MTTDFHKAINILVVLSITFLHMRAQGGLESPNAPPPPDVNVRASNLLDDAKLLYSRGELEEIPYILQQFVHDNSVRRGLRQEGYRLLTNTYLATNHVAEAETSYLGLLKLKPVFRPNRNAGDLRQMEWLATQFKSTAAWHLALTVNLYTVYPTLSVHRQEGESIAKDFATDMYERIKSWAPGIGLNAIVPLNQYFELGAGLEYQQLEFRHRYEFETLGSISLGSHRDGNCNGRGALTMAERQNFVGLPLSARYYPLRNDHYSGKKQRDFMPYVHAGVVVQFRSGGDIWQYSSRIFADPQDECVDASALDYPITDFSARVSRWNAALSAGGGVKYKVGAHYMFAEATYSWQLANARSGESPGESLERVYFVDNDYRLQFLTIRLGGAYSFYNPKLLD